MSEPLAYEFLRDEPQPLEDDDLLGHRDYVAVLVRALLAAPSRFTLGLFGAWGMGKSTILGELERKLSDEPTCAFVAFDAWRYEHDALRRELLREAARQLENELAGYDAARELGVLDEDVASPRELPLAFSLRHFAVSVVGLLVLASVYFAVGGTVADPAAGAVTVVLLATLITFVAARVERPLRVREATVTRGRLEDPDRFAACFRTLLGHLRSDVDRLVIAVDNLDRCAPAAVADLLSTIKTFLEPEAREQGARSVIFVIAVDDMALRRHLMTLAPARAGVTEAERESEARRYADDFLRKFFNASTRVRRLRSGDLTEYVRQRVAPIVEGWSLPSADPSLGAVPTRDEQLQQTVHMASVALQRNPRRVKQFVNDLQLQMGLIREREAPVGRVPTLRLPISSHFAMVAKLVLIEQEWPARYEQLLEDERRLEEWHAQAESSTATRADVEDEDVRDTSPPDADEALFARFLHESRHVRTPRARAFLELKLTATEARLPDFDRFRDAVIYGDMLEVVEILDAATPEHRRGYARELPGVLAKEAGRDLTAGVNVVRAALEVERLWVEVDARTRVLERAVGDDGIRAGLADLPPGRLVEAAGPLHPADRQIVLEGLAGRLASAPGGAHELAVASALARVPPEQLGPAHSKLAGVADVMFRWLANLDHGEFLRSLRAAQELARGQPLGDDPGSGVAFETARFSVSRAWSEAIATETAKLLQRCAKTSRDEASVPLYLRYWLPAAAQLEEPARLLLAQTVLEQLREVAEHDGHPLVRRAWMLVGGGLTDLLPRRRLQPSGTDMAEAADLDLEAIVDLASNGADALPTTLRRPFAARLVAALDDPELGDRARSALELLQREWLAVDADSAVLAEAANAWLERHEDRTWQLVTHTRARFEGISNLEPEPGADGQAYLATATFAVPERFDMQSTELTDTVWEDVRLRATLRRDDAGAVLAEVHDVTRPG